MDLKIPLMLCFLVLIIASESTAGGGRRGNRRRGGLVKRICEVFSDETAVKEICGQIKTLKVEINEKIKRKENQKEIKAKKRAFKDKLKEGKNKMKEVCEKDFAEDSNKAQKENICKRLFRNQRNNG